VSSKSNRGDVGSEKNTKGNKNVSSNSMDINKAQHDSNHVEEGNIVDLLGEIDMCMQGKKKKSRRNINKKTHRHRCRLIAKCKKKKMGRRKNKANSRNKNKRGVSFDHPSATNQ